MIDHTDSIFSSSRSHFQPRRTASDVPLHQLTTGAHRSRHLWWATIPSHDPSFRSLVLLEYIPRSTLSPSQSRHFFEQRNPYYRNGGSA